MSTQPADEGAYRDGAGPRRTSLATRISVLAVGVAVLTSLVAALIGVSLLREASEQTARGSLNAIADQAQVTVEQATDPQAGQARARRALRSLSIQIAVVRRGPAGPTLSGDPLARQSMSAAQAAQVLDGQRLSLRIPRDGGAVLVEARPTPAGGLVVAQRRDDAVALGDQALRRLTWALAATGAVAALLGLLVARRLAQPLRRAAAATGELARGHREVVVPERGPREVAEVAGSVNRLAAALSRSEARQRDFLLSVSHDLRTPLTAINGYAESLGDGVVPPDRVADVGHVLEAESQRMRRLVDDLLDLARLDATEPAMTPSTVDVADLTRDVGRAWSQRCAAARIPLRTDVVGSGLLVRADPQRLRQAVDNLLENALRVTPEGAPVVLAASAEPGAVVLEVRDGGPGLTDEDLPVAFDRQVLYERYRSVRQVGTGLGLAIVERIVTRLGGRVSASHAVEGGACFRITLPRLATGV
ncbi:HAMP domain-containing sensor histidine kinase [Luteipulveratus sp. YIM 133132]|uniref:sensor histidine kinase n=1 Tax=Luteipulveratus flavus TaxID=3031728 RepID=UPI0023B032A8|nr:HAMP domain-containing sensor histidine kinase [Luteipulveratus sp. YIM 133132]MDE9365620.1 HAMP domain-containing sensor histidine kinase [Luteipulveratus sp. YIM 133132]